MQEQLTISLPLPVRVLQPNCTIATYGGRMKKAAATKRYRWLTRRAVQDEQIETGPWEKVGVTAEFFFRDGRRRDQDNAMASLKAAYDGIVDSELVPDDDFKHMRREAPNFSVDKINPRVELTITRIE